MARCQRHRESAHAKQCNSRIWDLGVCELHASEQQGKCGAAGAGTIWMVEGDIR
jgi:hypothetical protein